MRKKKKIKELKIICAEAYQVVAKLSLDKADPTKQIEHVLDNLSQQKRIHKDVLPFVILPRDTLSCGCGSNFLGFPSIWSIQDAYGKLIEAAGSLCEEHYQDWNARPLTIL